GDTPKKKTTAKPTTAKETGKGTTKEEPALPRLYPRDVLFDPAKLHKEFEGPLAELSGPGPADTVLTVSRLGGGPERTYATLAEALAAAPEETRSYVVIADNGPIFLPALPAVSHRNLVICAAKTFRPLLVWDAAGPQRDRWLQVLDGSLTL